MKMLKKIGSFFEAHIEKIVLTIVGLVCIWILIFHVLVSPNAVSYGDGKFSPSDIDKRIQEQAKELNYKLRQPPEPKPEYVSRLIGALDPNDPVRTGIWGDLQNGFDGLFASAINGINTNLTIPMPPSISTEASGIREYSLPLTNGVICEVTDVSVEHIRAAAYVPTLQVTEDTSYENAAPEPNDIDLVTVEAKFEVEEVYRKFRESFAGEFVRQEWRDPCLAVPIFAAVQLQRQELLDDGSWSDRKTVPRTKIDYRKRMFEIIEDVENLPAGGMKVRLLQFNAPDVRMDLLQPQAYQVASAYEEWFPPSLHRKFLEIQRKEKTEQKREEMEARKEEEEREREQRLRDRPGRTSGIGGGINEGYGDIGGRGARGSQTRRSRAGRAGQTNMGRGAAGSLYGDRGLAGGRAGSIRGARGRGRGELDPEMGYMMELEDREIRKGPTMDDVYLDFEDICLTEFTDLSKWREPLVFWAHDDMVESGKTYRYQIRFGVLNPIAGTNQFNEKFKSYRNSAILWSEFSDITEPVSIPRRLYFFAKDIQEAAKKITVQVSKYVLGYWYSEDFPVKQGETIGKVVELEREDASDSRRLWSSVRQSGRTTAMVRRPVSRSVREFGYTRPGDETIEPEQIDYSTGAVLVDAVAVNDWSGEGSLRKRHYFEMLYSLDGIDIQRMPIKNANWPKELQVAFDEIRVSQRQEKEPLRSWQGGSGGRRRILTPEGYEGMRGMEDMMMEEMIMGGRGRGPY
jgi:hypothetical protein